MNVADTATASRAWIAADWPSPSGVHALSTTRRGLGVSKPPFDDFNLGIRNDDDIAAVQANRAELVRALALPSPPRWLRQVHGTAVARMSADDTHEVIGETEPAVPTAGRDTGSDDPQADASVTSDHGVVLAILTADCLPVVLAARDGSEIGAAHAGWRGLAAGVLEATVAAMRTPAAQLQAWLGPCAGPNAYEVGDEVQDAFVSLDSDTASAFAATRPGHWRVDLYALARKRLSDAGVGMIHGGGHCTISEPQRFFSHRRDQRTGRMATLAWMQP